MIYSPELRGMRDESRSGTGRNGTGWKNLQTYQDGTGRDKRGRDAGRNGIGLIHYFLPRILVKRNRLKILWVHRILTTSKH